MLALVTAVLGSVVLAACSDDAYGDATLAVGTMGAAGGVGTVPTAGWAGADSMAGSQAAVGVSTRERASLGETTLLDTSVPIPAAGGLLHVEQVAPVSIPEGTAVYFHLHNHGDNSWSFVELSSGPSGP